MRAKPDNFILDSLEIKDGELRSSGNLKLWEGKMHWNILGESQVETGYSAYLFASKKGEV